MRKVFTRGVLTLLAVLFLASKASAAPIAIGWLQWMEDTPDTGQGQFSVVNQTGVNWLGDPAFPVVTQLALSNLALVVDGNVSPLSPNAFDPNSYDSAVFTLPPSPLQAFFSGTVNVLQIMVDLDGAGGSPAVLYDLVNTGITDFLGNTPVVFGNGRSAIPNGDLVLLYVNGNPAQTAVPEPASMLLLGSGVAGLVARRRRKARAQQQ